MPGSSNTPPAAGSWLPRPRRLPLRRGPRKKKLGRPPAALAVSSTGISMGDIAAIKAIVDKLGINKVHELTSILAQ